MSCERIKKLWLRYSSGDLFGKKQRRFEEHLETCSACRARRLAFDRSTEAAGAALSASVELTPAEWRRVRPDPRPTLNRGRRPLAAALAAVACAAAVGVVLYFAPKAPVEQAVTADAGVALKQARPPAESDRYEVRMCTDDPKIKIVWVFDRNLSL